MEDERRLRPSCRRSDGDPATPIATHTVENGEQCRPTIARVGSSRTPCAHECLPRRVQEKTRLPVMVWIVLALPLVQNAHQPLLIVCWPVLRGSRCGIAETMMKEGNKGQGGQTEEAEARSGRGRKSPTARPVHSQGCPHSPPLVLPRHPASSSPPPSFSPSFLSTSSPFVSSPCAPGADACYTLSLSSVLPPPITSSSLRAAFL